MKHDQLKELWRIRFEKILHEEEESFFFYKNLIEENKDILKDLKSGPILEQIMNDEKKHAKVARRLLKIIEKTSSRG